MRRQGGGSAGARLSHASPEMGSDQLAPLPLHCPWGGIRCIPECVASGSGWGEGLAGRAETRWVTQQGKRHGVPTRVPRAAGAPFMSSQPRAWSIRGQWGRWGGGGSGDRQCPGAPPPSPPPILSMQMLFIHVFKLNSRRRWPESAILGSALSHFTGGQRPHSSMSTRKPPPIDGRGPGQAPSQFGVVTCWNGGAAGVQSSQQESPLCHSSQQRTRCCCPGPSPAPVHRPTHELTIGGIGRQVRLLDVQQHGRVLLKQLEGVLLGEPAVGGARGAVLQSSDVSRGGGAPLTQLHSLARMGVCVRAQAMQGKAGEAPASAS